MTKSQQLALTAYYWATLPVRCRAAAQRARNQREPVQILFNHRVADEQPNGWTISTSQFAKQINWLRCRFDLVSLAEAQSRIESGRNSRPTACITFDDGYADNMHFAVPLLLKYHIPFTYFVATDFVFNNKPFPHDIAATQPLAPNSLDDLRKLVAAGVDIGGHTRSHRDLGGPLSTDQLIDEIVGCKHELESALQTKIRYFAFPYGQHENLTATAFEIARDAGYLGVCSAYGGYNFPGEDSFHLRRFHADPELIRFKNWLTIDPRKLCTHRDFEPLPLPVSPSTVIARP